MSHIYLKRPGYNTEFLLYPRPKVMKIFLLFYDVLDQGVAIENGSLPILRIVLCTTKGPFIATQLNSTSSWDELSCVAMDTLTDATQLSPTIGNATDPVEQRTANQREAGQSSWVELRRRRYRDFADATQLNSTSSWVELCRCKRAFSRSCWTTGAPTARVCQRRASAGRRCRHGWVDDELRGTAPVNSRVTCYTSR